MKKRFRDPNIVPKTPQRQLEYQRNRRKNPEFREETKRYNRDYRRKHAKTLDKKNVEYYRKHRLRIQLRRKGIVDPKLLKKLEQHDGRCDICGKRGDGRWKVLNIDHCHKRRRFRGLLCSNCNLALGYFKDSVTLLRKAIRYLLKT